MSWREPRSKELLYGLTESRVKFSSIIAEQIAMTPQDNVVEG
jgi:hypothetical protein